MRKFILFLSVIFLFSFSGKTQSNRGIEVRNYKTQNLKFISEGSKVFIKKNGQTFKGTLRILSDKKIIINADTIQINQIQDLRTKTSSSTTGGVALLIPSSFIGATGTAFVIAGLGDLGGYGILGLVFGLPVATIGTFGAIKGIQLLSRGKKFASSKWEYSIAWNPETDMSN